ncbi:MAG: type III-B CRISPR-associated protein Cas10/Cmr2 [Lentisphaeria bacterium]|nr:type III-B CRISPR-associated protein Cas10/Cmr2 [Lentisphaeria bacterium]
MSERVFWQRKLAALLHDPPDKCLQIFRHEDAAKSFQTAAELSLDEADWKLVRAADHFTAASDRFVFPQRYCATSYSQVSKAAFIHPMSSVQAEIDTAKLVARKGELHGILQSAVNAIGTSDPKVAHFLYWRRWLENAVTSDASYSSQIALLPADTRIPDHSIWVHNAMASALSGCAEQGRLRPALLLFQLGGVQEFISQARSTRDLWSGSYLLSWLMAHAMKAISDELGPDAMVFPNLRGNGIFDALHKDSHYAVQYKGKGDRMESLWERILADKRHYAAQSGGQKADAAAQWLLTPTLPNKFLALVPESRAEELAAMAAESLKAELQRIGDAVWTWLEQQGVEAGCQGLEHWRQRWQAQIKAYPQCSWAVQGWLSREECLEQAARLPAKQAKDKDGSPLENLQKTLLFAEQWLPFEQRDKRFYEDEQTKERLNNPGVLWSLHYALLDAKLAARRNCNNFSAWENPWPEASVKDSLSGKEEIIGDEQFWQYLHSRHPELFSLRREADEETDEASEADEAGESSRGHRYGAMNLIKRLWCRDKEIPYLREALGLNPRQFGESLGFDSVEDIAKNNRHQGSYVAIIAMDGDEMGKWISGEKLPAFLDQLSDPACQHLKAILEKAEAVNLRRLLTPSYHLQLSEALANFATWVARPLVEHYCGQLIYAGGDDVLAMLPADRALDCAKALRQLFRGEEPEEMSQMPLNADPEGNFVRANAGYPLMMPGSKCDVSLGMAIGHYKAPLQTLVKEAKLAEGRAKKEYGRSALAFSLYKRSGEILQWGCNWNSAALPLMQKLEEMSLQPLAEPGLEPPPPRLSGRFPYALAALLQSYRLHKTPDIGLDKLADIIWRDSKLVLSRQSSKEAREEKTALAELGEQIQSWLHECKNTQANPDKKRESLALADFIQPFLTQSFISRKLEG